MDSVATIPDVVLNTEEQRLRHAAKDGQDGAKISYFIVPSMTCSGCMTKIERNLAELPHVQFVRANLSTKRVRVDWDPLLGGAKEISDRLGALGYEHTSWQDEQLSGNDPVGRRLLVALGIAGFAAANIMLLSVSVWSGADAETRQLFHLISGLIAVPAVAIAGRPFFSSALGALRNHQLNMDVPISLAVILAVGMSLAESIRGGPHAYFDASVMLLFFLLIGRYLDHLMRERSRGAVKQLADMTASGATVLSADGKPDFVPLHEIAVGMRMMVTAGERVPVDATVLAGKSDVDRSLVTGESMPDCVTPGDEVEAGTLNLSGALELIATKTAEHSYLAEVSQMMEAAEQGQSRFVRIADRFASLYAPAVHILALLTFTGWVVATSGDVTLSLYRAIAVLIITCPCALGLAVPIAHIVGAGRLFSTGVMVKDGAAFEKLATIDTVVFDKTGTLTIGNPAVVAVTQVNESDLECAASLASCSRHPSATAVAKFLAGTSARAKLEDMIELPGCGMQAKQDGDTVRLGKADWVAEISPDVPAGDDDGTSRVCFARSGSRAITFTLRDAIRDDAFGTVQLLRERGVRMEILSGDAPAPVRQIAGTLGVTNWQAGLAPRDKTARVTALQEEGRNVLMVGDGINDAPALAAAHVSMAPSSGSDIGRQAADLVFTGKSLGSVTRALMMAQRVDALVRQNFALALVYNVCAVPLAVLGYVTPLVAAIAMSGSSILVVANSMRLHIDGRETQGKVRGFTRGEAGASARKVAA